MGFVKKTFGGSGFGAATPGSLTSFLDPGDLLGTFSAGEAKDAQKDATKAQLAAVELAQEEARRASGEALGFLEPFSGVGAGGVEQAGFLTDPQAQFDFLQSNPLFQLALENANRGTSQTAAASGRSSFGTTQQDFFNNALLSAQPLIAQQKQSIGDLLNVGTGVSRSQANAALGLGSDLQNLAQSQGNVQSSGILGQSQIATDTANQRNELAGTVAGIFGFSDPALKTNKKVIGERNGFTIWSWCWNELANKLGLFGSGEGVMADEVNEKMPGAVILQNGYMKVNYEMIGVHRGY